MTRKEIFRRYLLFAGAVFVNAVGISIITKALLGTSSISSVPFVLSLFTPFSMGVYTIAWNTLFVLIEMTMMSREEIRRCKFELFIQIPISIGFGFFIDMAMLALSWLAPATYLAKVVTLLVGCLVLGIGVSWEVKANVAMVAGEYLVHVISNFVKREFGYVKVAVDCTFVATATLLSFIFMGHLEGVREGTLISALIIGPISHWVYPLWRVFDRWLVCGKEDELEGTQEAAGKRQPVIITITREFGSGGRLLGKALADALGIKFYDKELITMVAEDSRRSERYVEDNEQRLSSNALLNLILQDYESPMERSLSSYDALFVSQSRVIRQLARKESCVIVGRCADYILKDFPTRSIIKVFCYTNADDARKRCVEIYHDNPESITDRIQEANRARIAHYQHYTGRKWGDAHYYDIMVNTGTLPVDTACKMISGIYRERLEAVAESQ